LLEKIFAIVVLMSPNSAKKKLSWTAQIFMIQELAPLNVGNHLPMDMASYQRNPQYSEYVIAKHPVMKVLFSTLLLLLLLVVVVVVVVVVVGHV